MNDHKPEYKIIRDVVHGYISLVRDDLLFIDTPSFQRLRRIHQIAASAVYPGANHTRFEHSLGVMHLGAKVFESIIRDSFYTNLEKYKSTVRYACLLHDIGHAPLSHIGEAFYQKDLMLEQLMDVLSRRGYPQTFSGDGAAPHEICSCIIALDLFFDPLIHAGVDINLFCRMIIGEKFQNGESYKNCLISILNSDIDVDKLDYILRDSFMTGVQFVALDVDRLIFSYRILGDDLAFDGTSLSIVNNLIHGRNAMYHWVYNHHITVYIDCLFKRYIRKITQDPELINNLFSYHAIAHEFVDDVDIVSEIRRLSTRDPELHKMYSQLFHRNYFKPIWKNPFEFDSLLPDSQIQDKLIHYCRLHRNNPETLEVMFQEHSPIEIFDRFYISLAHFKPFSPISGSSIYLLLKYGKKRFQDIFQESVLKSPKAEIPYIFTESLEIQNEIIRLIKSGILR